MHCTNSTVGFVSKKGVLCIGTVLCYYCLIWPRSETKREREREVNVHTVRKRERWALVSCLQFTQVRSINASNSQLCVMGKHSQPSWHQLAHTGICWQLSFQGLESVSWKRQTSCRRASAEITPCSCNKLTVAKEVHYTNLLQKEWGSVFGSCCEWMLFLKILNLWEFEQW